MIQTYLDPRRKIPRLKAVFVEFLFFLQKNYNLDKMKNIKKVTNMLKTSYATVFSDCNDDGHIQNIVRKFVELHEESTPSEITLSIKNIYITGTIEETIRAILGDELKDSKITVINTGEYIIQKESTLVYLTVRTEAAFSTKSRKCSAKIFGQIKFVQPLYERLIALSEESPVLRWYYLDGDDINYSVFNMDTKLGKFFPEFYPWIENVKKYINDFNDSSSNILVLLGEPGTGKTSFVRYLLKSANKNCYTTYDEDVMTSDRIYIDFIGDDDADYLVLEDSDLILGSRIHDSNKVMSKILNAADGLIPLNKKKFVFTANINDASKIDDALIRPGRCFDILHFRALTHEEAMRAAEVSGNVILDKASEYTLAEIFNGQQKKYFNNRFA